MFSKKMLVVIGAIIFILANFTILTISSKGQLPENSFERFTIALIAPFQMMVSRTIVFTEQVWEDYFSLVAASHENSELKNK